jgi:hypothetical protein
LKILSIYADNKKKFWQRSSNAASGLASDAKASAQGAIIIAFQPVCPTFRPAIRTKSSEKQMPGRHHAHDELP